MLSGLDRLMWRLMRLRLTREAPAPAEAWAAGVRKLTLWAQDGACGEEGEGEGGGASSPAQPAAEAAEAVRRGTGGLGLGLPEPVTVDDAAGAVAAGLRLVGVVYLDPGSGYGTRQLTFGHRAPAAGPAPGPIDGQGISSSERSAAAAELSGCSGVPAVSIGLQWPWHDGRAGEVRGGAVHGTVPFEVDACAPRALPSLVPALGLWPAALCCTMPADRWVHVFIECVMSKP